MSNQSAASRSLKVPNAANTSRASRRSQPARRDHTAIRDGERTDIYAAPAYAGPVALRSPARYSCGAGHSRAPCARAKVPPQMAAMGVPSASPRRSAESGSQVEPSRAHRSPPGIISSAIPRPRALARATAESSHGRNGLRGEGDRDFRAFPPMAQFGEGMCRLPIRESVEDQHRSIELACIQTPISCAAFAGSTNH